MPQLKPAGPEWLIPPGSKRTGAPSQRSLHVTFPLSSFQPVPQAQSVDPARGPLAPTAHWHRDSTGIPDGLNTNVYEYVYHFALDDLPDGELSTTGCAHPLIAAAVQCIHCSLSATT